MNIEKNEGWRKRMG